MTALILVAIGLAGIYAALRVRRPALARAALSLALVAAGIAIAWILYGPAFTNPTGYDWCRRQVSAWLRDTDAAQRPGESDTQFHRRVDLLVANCMRDPEAWR